MNVSIPLEQGNVFRLNHEEVIKTEERVSIPLEQGNVFRLIEKQAKSISANSFNPFGTGQCLSTAAGCSSLVWQGFPEPLPKLF